MKIVRKIKNRWNEIETLLVDDNTDYTNTNVEDFTIQKIMYQSDFNGDGLVMDKDTHMVKKLNKEIKGMYDDWEKYEYGGYSGVFNIQQIWEVFSNDNWIENYKDENGEGVFVMDDRILIKDNNGNEYIPTNLQNIPHIESMEEV